MEDQVQKGLYQNYEQLKRHKMAYQAKPQIVKLTTHSKQLFGLFNLFELEVNRFTNLDEFQVLAQEITNFNQQLVNWKTRDKDIKNLFPTYYLYQNLFARLKYVSNFVLDRGEAKRAYRQVGHWFLQEKPKVRNQAPDKEEGQMKPTTALTTHRIEIDSLLQSSINKRQLTVYQAMARTAHPNFFPPRQRLMQYKRKELFQGFAVKALTERRNSSVSNLSKVSKMRSTYRTSFGTTRSTLKVSEKQSLKRQDKKQEPIIVPFQIAETHEQGQLILDFEKLEDLGKERRVQQEEFMQQNLVVVLDEEDQGGEEQVLSEQEKKVSLLKKKYQEDPNAEAWFKAEEDIKDVRQSTLRRILKEKQLGMRMKMEELEDARQMANWGGIKSRQNTNEARKLQRNLLANRYTDLTYRPQTFDEKTQARRRAIPQFQMSHRSKSSQPTSLESQIEKLKITGALRTYGKYIQHIPIKTVIPENAEQVEQMRIMRATSLTSLSHKGKRTPFSTLVEARGVDEHNEEAQQHLIRIKDTLAQKSIAIQNQVLMKALSVTDTRNLDPIEPLSVYPPDKVLFNNPFFPKHLYQTKAKKKKK